jgi:hypothetical protein
MDVRRIIAVAFLVFAVTPAAAVDRNQLIESCRNSVGKPIVVACKQGGGDIEACREKARPKVQACVQAALEKSLPKQAAPSAAKPEAAPSAEDIAKAAPTSLVAPPRTVADVTAILNQQKPDPARTADLNAAADAPVPDGLKGNQLADFYYKRGQARAQLGRNDESLADAELAVSNGKGAEYANVASRFEQFLMRRLRDAGQHTHVEPVVARVAPGDDQAVIAWFRRIAYANRIQREYDDLHQRGCDGNGEREG